MPKPPHFTDNMQTNRGISIPQQVTADFKYIGKKMPVQRLA